MNNWLIRAWLPVILALSACVGTQKPESIAERFWIAVKAQDEEKVRGFTTRESQSVVDVSDSRWRGMEFGLGDIKITASEAEIGTNVTFPGRNTGSDTSFDTVLKKEAGGWKVDYAKTMTAIEEQNPLFGLTRRFERFGAEVAKNIDDVLSKMEDELPKIENEVEQLGNALLKELDKSVEKQLPAIQKQIDAFQEALEKAIAEATTRKEERRSKPDPNNKLQTI